MLFTKRRDAESAALIKRISRRVHRPEVIQRLGVFAGNSKLFVHDEIDEDEWDWEQFEDRCAVERAIGAVAGESLETGQSPKVVVQNQQKRRINGKAEMTLALMPELKLRQTIAAANITDPTSVDYCDPHDTGRTKLIKAVIDHDIHEVKRLVEVEHANLYVRDDEGRNALIMSMNYGFMDISAYLQAQMNANPMLGVHKVKIA